jgi:hypothetical protein
VNVYKLSIIPLFVNFQIFGKIFDQQSACVQITEYYIQYKQLVILTKIN